MREEYKSEEWADFRQRYEGTYGWYEREEGKSPLLVRLDVVRENSLSFVDASGFIYTAIPDKGNNFQFIPVERGVYNLNNDVVFCQRIPARQWRRGMCQANTAFVSMTGTQKYTGPSFPLLEQIFNPKPGAKTVLDNFMKSFEGIAALNHTFSIIKNNVHCFNIVIGSYTKGQILLDDKLFCQELNDLVRDMHLPIRVEVKQ